MRNIFELSKREQRVVINVKGAGLEGRGQHAPQSATDWLR